MTIHPRIRTTVIAAVGLLLVTGVAVAQVDTDQAPVEEPGATFPTFPDLSDIPGEFDDGVPFVGGRPTGDAPDDPSADDAGPPFTPGAPLPAGPPEWADGSDDDGEGPPFRGTGWTPGTSTGPPPWAGGEGGVDDQGPPLLDTAPGGRNAAGAWTPRDSTGPPPWAGDQDDDHEGD